MFENIGALYELKDKSVFSKLNLIDAPFNAHNSYPEYPFPCKLSNYNPIYASVRELFKILKLDINNYSKKNWNPLGKLISPGNSVVIKPNLVRHYHGSSEDLGSVLTNGAIIRAVLDYVYIALKGEGKVVIGDAPLQSADFEQIKNITGLNQVKLFYEQNSNLPVEVMDFRKECIIKDSENSPIKEKRYLAGDTAGYVTVELGDVSEHNNFDSAQFRKFRVTQYDKNKMLLHHNDKNHKYVISKSALNADVFINLPKLKTHRKAGLTASLKNLVGINGSKDCIPHHRFGSMQNRCDEYLYSSFRKRIISYLWDMENNSNGIKRTLTSCLSRYFTYTNRFIKFKDPYFEGSWWGNNTIAYSVLDFNKIIKYVDCEGNLNDNPQRKYFTLIDAIVAGESEGPLSPRPRNCGILIAGSNPLVTDLICCSVMGFDYRKIPTLSCGLGIKKYPLFGFSIDEIVVLTNIYGQVKFSDLTNKYNFHFTAPNGWQGHIESLK